MDTVLVLVAASIKVMLVVAPRLVGRTMSAVALSNITDDVQLDIVPVIVIAFVTLFVFVPLVPVLVRLIILVNVPTFDPLILDHNKILVALFVETLGIINVFVNVELFVDTCQFVESEIVTVMLVIKFVPVTRNARLALG